MTTETKRTILVVDDDPAIVELFKHILLKNTGHYVTTAENGSDALNKMSDTDFDLVLTDWRMPVMGGQDLLENLNSTHPVTPTIVISAASEPENIVQALHSGAINFLPKPVKREVLLTIVEKGLKQRDLLLRTAKESKKNTAINEYISGIGPHCYKYKTSYEFPVSIADNIDDLIKMLQGIWHKSAMYGGFKGATKNFSLLADELFSNSINYGCLGVLSNIRDSCDFDGQQFEDIVKNSLEDQAHKTVKVHFDVTPDRFQVTVNDGGKGFDWRHLPTDIMEILDKPHGRGILLMKSLGAELSWNEKGNEVTFSLNA